MILHRCPEWEKQLEAYIDESKTRTFEWGTCDCVHWAAEWFQRLTGYNFLEEFGGWYYDSEKTAYEMLALLDDSLASEISFRLPSRPAGFHKRGDIALCLINGKETLGIVGARGFVFFKAMGLGVIAKRIDVVQAWGCD